MQNAWSWQPVVDEPRHLLPSSSCTLAAAHQRTLPKLSNTDSEHHQAPIVRRHRVVCKEAPDHLSQPFPLFRNRLVPPALQFSLHSLYRGLHAITSRPPLELESAHSFLPADHRKAQKGEGLRFTLPTFPPVECCVAPKPNDPCLFRMQRE